MALSVRRAAVRARALLPEGRALPDDVWRQRHRGLLRLLWVHVVGLFVFGIARGESFGYTLIEAAIIAIPAIIATSSRPSRQLRSVVCALGLVTASAVFVHLSGGVVEVHFHYFVMVGLLSLYQEWRPFLLAVGFVAVQHGIVGWLAPTSVYNHEAAINGPWKWAAVHSGFLLAASVANLVAWRVNEHQALHDALTGLPNRALLADRIEHAQQRRDPRALALLFVDLDTFKAVNDNFGHTLGDQLLVAVSDRLRSCLRAGDTVARLGGDEFAILLESLAAPADALLVAQRLLDALAGPFVLPDRQLRCTASIGVALSMSDSIPPDDLLRNADIAMYAAKRGGRARYEVFEPELRSEVLDRIELEHGLTRALEYNEFVLHYQPVVDLGTGRVQGMEALVRWQHPHRGLLLPGEFIAVAEESGAIVPMGTWVLEEACRQTAAWNKDRGLDGHEPLALSVNLSPKQLEDGVVEVVNGALRRSGLGASSLTLEITENVIVQDSEEHLSRLQALRALGVRIAVDDFGTGYSSLSYLRRLPMDVVKIDRSFVNALTDGAEDVALVDAIVRLCRALNLDLIAEGVESHAQVEALRELGVQTAQGYEFARPASAERAGAVASEVLVAPAAPRHVDAVADHGIPANGVKVDPVGVS
jgi:diguanylate cyclase (GGDEF)-like protein